MTNGRIHKDVMHDRSANLEEENAAALAAAEMFGDAHPLPGRMSAQWNRQIADALLKDN